MSWEVIKANRMAEGSPWVSIGVHRRGNYLQAKITMSKSVVKHLGVKSGEKVMISKGIDEHDGWIQIERAPAEFTDGMMLTDRKMAVGNLSFRFAAGHFGLQHHKTVKINENDASLCLTKMPIVRALKRVVQFEIPESIREDKR